MKKKEKEHIHLKVDAEIWARAKVVIKEMGFTQSGFVELMVKQFLRAEEAPFSAILGDILQEAAKAQGRVKK